MILHAITENCKVPLVLCFYASSCVTMLNHKHAPSTQLPRDATGMCACHKKKTGKINIRPHKLANTFIVVSVQYQQLFI